MPTRYRIVPDDIPHKCLIQKEADFPGEFRRMVAEHEYEGEIRREFAVSFIIGTVAIQVDFCPFCGEELSTALRYGYIKPDVLRVKRAEERRSYLEYRRRFVRQGKADAPLRESTFNEIRASLAEVELLLAGGAGRRAAELFSLKQKLYDKLCLPDLRPEDGSRIEIAKEPLPDYSPRLAEGWGADGWYS